MHIKYAPKMLHIGRFIMLSLLLIIVACGEERSERRATGARANARSEVANSKSVAASTNWPTFMHDISYQGISQDAILRPPLALVWKFKTGGPVNSSPVVADGAVYIGSDDHRIYALNARKWGVKWEFEAGDRILYAPTVYDGTVYFSARDNKVYALDAATGKKKWDFQADGWINAPVAAFRQRIYFGSFSRKIYILNAVTGKEESLEVSSIEIGRFRYISSDGEFYPMDARLQASKWRKALPPSESWPARANGVVYIGARDNILRAFDYNTQEIIWQFSADGWVDSSPAVADGMLYFGSRDGYVYAFGNATDAPQREKNHADKKTGVITRDRVRIYDKLNDKAKIIALLNEGRSLPIADEGNENWYEVILPDERHGWVSASDFIAIRQVEDLQINDLLVKDVIPVALPRDAEEPSWSPDGTILAFFDNISRQSVYWRAKSIWLANSDGSDPVWVADGSFYNPRISWSRDGKLIAFENLSGTNREVWVVRSNGTGMRKITDGEAPALSPRGGKVAFIDRRPTATTVFVRELRNGGERKLAEFPVTDGGSDAAYNYIPIIDPPAWSSGGARLAIGLDNSHYSRKYSSVAVVGGGGAAGIMREIAVRAERIRDISWSPDGNYLAYVTQGHPDRYGAQRLDKQVHLTDLGQRGREQDFQNCEGIAWSSDGRYMAFIEENDCMGMRRKVWLFDVDSQRRIQLLASREKIHRIFWLPGGKIALIASAVPSKTASRTRAWLASINSLPE